MASAQVLPSAVASSKKQEHLQAGKRRLEEFRKKKAADRAKKAPSANASEANFSEKQPLESEHVRVTDTAEAGPSDGHVSSFTESSSVGTINDNSSDFIQKNEAVSSNDTSASPLVINENNLLSSERPPEYARPPEFKRFGDSGFGVSLTANESNGRTSSDLYDQFIASHSQEGEGLISSTTSPFVPGKVDAKRIKENGYAEDYTRLNADSSHVSVVKISPQTEPVSASGFKSSSLYEDLIRPTAGRKGFYQDSAPNVFSFKPGKENISTDTSSLYSVENKDVQAFESVSYDSNFRTSPSHLPLHPVRNETYPRQSRPSFLDNLNINRASSGTQFQKNEVQDTFMPNGLGLNSMNMQGSSPLNTPSVAADGLSPFSKHDSIHGNGFEMKHEFYLPKQDENFSALEQHIEDLTQEKFSLQRALDASRALSESLAAENSSLTDTYNQQRGVVDQLKSDMEMLQREIKAQLAELEAFRNEYANAQLECTASDERAKLLASEVIGLEEKALRLRSNELKLERQLENSEAEISSYRKKMSSLEKDRTDLLSTIDALQEEKKLMQSKLWKASTDRKFTDTTKSSANKKDVCTSTEDLETDVTAVENEITSQEMCDANLVENQASSSTIFPSNEDSFATIPPEQLRMIQNINTLISELALEKQELVQALTSESSQSSKLKELNNELSLKLEAQTQRLELLTAQTMANGNVSATQLDSRGIRDNVPYTDEGDEVVERVLGWIMKLFPGGPAKRRTSKLL